MNKNTARTLRGQLETIFENVPVEGFDIEVGNASYTSSEVTFRVTLREEGVESMEMQTARMMAEQAGINMQNEAGDQITGYNPRAPKYPWIVTKAADGRSYKFSDTLARFIFKKAAA